MMRGLRSGLIVLVVVGGVVATTSRLSLHAQPPPLGPAAPVELPKEATQRPEAPCTVQEALVKPFHLPFGDPTRLDQVCRHLRRTLNAPVVLDLAALQRQEVRPEDTVELELEGVRLKTGLQLLLDQVGLTYRVIPEDNLLIVTDDQGADDPLKRLQAEVHELHLDIHDVQDAVDEVRSALGLDAEGAKVRKPTIIEEMPQEPAGEPAGEPAEPPVTHPRPRQGI